MKKKAHSLPQVGVKPTLYDTHLGWIYMCNYIVHKF